MGVWHAHPSPEGGRDTIGYGHKLTKDEEDILALSDAEVEQLLRLDIQRAEAIVRDTIGIVNFNRIPLNRIEMLVDFAFNLGTLKTFPNFVQAVLDEDWDTMRQEYKRYYRDSKGTVRELRQRNRIFYNTYLKEKERA